MSEALLPCPFCGGKAILEHDFGNEVWRQSWECKCTQCGVKLFKNYGSSSWAVNKKQDALALETSVAAWNRRTPPPSAAPVKPTGWQPIESAPKGRKLIVGYPNKLGKWRTVMGCYYNEGELQQADDYGDEFAPAGWYEESESHEYILATDETPTHWLPLPSAPKGEGS